MVCIGGKSRQAGPKPMAEWHPRGGFQMPLSAKEVAVRGKRDVGAWGVGSTSRET